MCLHLWRCQGVWKSISIWELGNEKTLRKNPQHLLNSEALRFSVCFKWVHNGYRLVSLSVRVWGQGQTQFSSSLIRDIFNFHCIFIFCGAKLLTYIMRRRQYEDRSQEGLESILPRAQSAVGHWLQTVGDAGLLLQAAHESQSVTDMCLFPLVRGLWLPAFQKYHPAFGKTNCQPLIPTTVFIPFYVLIHQPGMQGWYLRAKLNTSLLNLVPSFFYQ